MNASTAHTYDAIPPITMNAEAETAHPLRPLFVTVIALKLTVAAVLLATVSLAPPISADEHYINMASN